MINDKDNEVETGRKQPVQNSDSKINPFKEPLPAEDPQQRREDEIEMEQQRKEALTERD